jgi:alkylation response protein AidB-like acyl-CoA dehydrogenase
MLAGRVARALCYAPAYTIQGGTSSILRNVIGERLLGLPR